MYIIYPQSNGQLAVISPCGTLEEAKKDIPAGVSYKIVNSVDIDNYFFDAYEFDETHGTKINTSKAKEIQLNKFREARIPLLQQLDVEFMRAIEQQNTDQQQKIIEQKQALRDVTKIMLPESPNHIKKMWPKILGPANKQ